jgi:hypothetical protein
MARVTIGLFIAWKIPILNRKMMFRKDGIVVHGLKSDVEIFISCTSESRVAIG